MKTAVILAGGPLPPEVLPYLLQEQANLWVGVDSGARHFAKIHRLPNIITGDFDSLTIEEQEYFATQGTKIIHTPDQDYTDIDKSIGYVLSHYPITQIHLYGATGGQTDHFLSVLSALIKYQDEAAIKLIDEHGEVWLASNDEEIKPAEGANLMGRLFSLIALGEVTGIVTTGLQWPLQCETLAPGVRDGTRNRIVDNIVTIKKQSGHLFLMLHHEK
jgi:thiamine pyrophosphokinase